MPMPQKKTNTIYDIYALPDGKRAELIDGQIYMMAPPVRIHQKLVSELVQKIGGYIKSKGGSCDLYPAPFGVFLCEDESTYIEPDISVICDKSKLTDEGCTGAPDFIIEVVSPSSRKMDYCTKNNLYANAGVREYWIVDPMKQRTTVYRYEEDVAPVVFSFAQEIAVGIYNDLKIQISELLT